MVRKRRIVIKLAARLMLRRQITDREYRLALRAAATKSASRSWRTYTSILYYSYIILLYYIIRKPQAAATHHPWAPCGKRATESCAPSAGAPGNLSGLL
jgi:hypothetical protein